MSLVPQHFTFEGHPLTLLTHQDRPAWIAREVGAALGYGDEGGNLVTKLTRDWGDELVEGSDYTKLTRDALPDDLSGSRTPSLVILFETGLHGVLLLSRQPRARAMRRWLREEVLPQLARDGRYLPTRHVEPTTGQVVGPAPVQVSVDLAPLGQALGMLADLQRETLATLRVVVERLDRPALPAPAPVPVAPEPPPVEADGVAHKPHPDALRAWLDLQEEPFTLTAAGRAFWATRRRLTDAEYEEVRGQLLVAGYERQSQQVRGKWRHRWALPL